MKYMFVFMLCALSGCYLYDDVPDFNPDDGAPCEPFEDIPGPVYLCADGQHKGIVFVDETNQGVGTKADPVQSLKAALELVRQDDQYRAIFIAGSPRFEGSYHFADGVSVIGGFDASFKREGNARPTIENVVDVDERNQRITITTEALTEPVFYQNLIVNSADHNDGPSIGMIIDQATNARLINVSITAGKGGAGQLGTDGDVGANGVDGSPGGTPSRRDGGQGAASQMCTDAKGGDGGKGEAKSGGQSSPGSAGQNSIAGTFGGAIDMNGSVGIQGDNGDDGKDAKPGQFDALGYVSGMPATMGQAGSEGQGGGGGGGGKVTGDEGTAGGGGAGGNGGCGGQGGSPGTSGSPSVALVLIQSNVSLDDQCVLSSSDGGDAGVGGLGGAGGLGGKGAVGAQGLGQATQGATGGDGGNGGAGGKGGNGLPGLSAAVVCQQSQFSVNNATLNSTTWGKSAGGDVQMAQTSIGCN